MDTQRREIEETDMTNTNETKNGNPIWKEGLPYEKFLARGPETLSDEELLAVIIRTGTKDCSALELGRQVLKAGGERGLLGLYSLSVEQLMQISGIGQVKAVKIKCIAELSARLSQAGRKEQVRFDRPDTVADYYMEQLRHLEHEEMLLIMTDGKNQKIGEKIVAKGSVNSACISPREILTEALSRKAVYLMLLHNHPSGDPTPSQADLDFTRQMAEASRLVGIPLLDHIVIGDRTYVSFREKGLL